MDWSILQFLAAPIVASLIIAGIHAYLGLHVVERGVIFVDRFGLDVIGYVEPKPGIPPSPSHTLELIDEMKRQGIKLILVEPYFDLKTPQAIANQVGGKVLILAPSVGGTKEATDYIQLFEYDVNLLASTLKQITGK